MVTTAASIFTVVLLYIQFLELVPILWFIVTKKKQNFWLSYVNHTKQDIKVKDQTMISDLH